MAIADSRNTTTTSRVIIDAEGAREVGPTEAAGLVRECQGLFFRRLDAACWRALAALAAPGGVPSLGPDEQKVARAVERERGKFFSRFRSDYEQMFAARQAGKPRLRLARGKGGSPTLALVGEDDLADQVSLKSAVQAMRTAVREEGFGFDLRARMILREAATEGEFDNPFGADYVCDAIGSACREVFAADDTWRPVMEHLVRSLTPEIVSIHRELSDLLQDRDVLPVLRVRTRKRGASAADGPSEGANALYRKVIDRMGGQAPAAAPSPGQPSAPPASGGPLDFGDAGTWTLPEVGATAAAAAPAMSALSRALALLAQAKAPGDAWPAGVDPSALLQGTANALPQLAKAVAAEGGPAHERAALEILGAVMDEVFDSPYLPDAIKTVFGRLQIPMLKAALADASVFTQPQHRVRRFFDTLAQASVGLRPDDEHDALFILLADHLAEVIRDDLARGLPAFDAACDALLQFLDSERAAFNQKLTQAVPALIALDDYATARTRVQGIVAMRLAAKPLAPELRAYFDHDGLDRLTAAYLEDGADGEAFRQALADVDDLLWSLAPGPGPDARRRLVQLVPQLVRKFAQGWPADDNAKARRKVFLAALYTAHIEAMKPRLPDLPSVDEEMPRAPIAAADAIVVAEASDDADTLLRGDWCVFTADDGASLLAKFAWRAPNGTQLLFTYRDGSIAVIHTPATFARAVEQGRARVAVEAAPLFERAMEQLVENS